MIYENLLKIKLIWQSWQSFSVYRFVCKGGQTIKHIPTWLKEHKPHSSNVA